MDKKKSLLEILLMPLIIATIGVVGTYFVTHQQVKSAEINRLAQVESAEKIAKSEEQVKLLDIFSEKITSPKAEDREIAVRILSTLDEELSKKLAKVIVDNTQEDSLIRNIASQYLDEKIYVVVGSYSSLSNAAVFADSLANTNIPYGVKVLKSNRNIYAVCVGVPNSISEANEILNYLKNRGIGLNPYLKYSRLWREP